MGRTASLGPNGRSQKPLGIFILFIALYLGASGRLGDVQVREQYLSSLPTEFILLT